MPELIFFRRGDEVLKLSLERERVVLGRGETSDVVIPDSEVSRQQVAVAYSESGYLLQDLSGKGTLLAGELVNQGPLKDGADIALGQWRAIFRERSAGDELAQATHVDGTQTEQLPKEDSDAAQRWVPAQIRVRQGASESIHKLAAEAFTVGKEPTNDLVLDDRFISGRHLRIARKDGLFQVVDQRSRNGTFIGPVRVYEAEVPLFTTLRLGESELTVEPQPQTGKKDAGFFGMIGKDPSLRHLVDLIERVGPSGAAVAIFGETGTGKELVARALHGKSSRAEMPLIPVNCGAISKELVESELFGHEKGSFTGAVNARKGAFEEADGGTLFLDEVGELPLELQAKLLRALESGEIKRVGAARPINVDVRVIAATHQDLLALSREGKFREDLYYRLCVIPLHVPPLRSRRNDVLAIAEHFVDRFAPRGQTVRFTPAAIARLQGHTWPGNIRELRNVVHRALFLRKGPMIDAGDLTFDQERNAEAGVHVPELPQGVTLEQMLEKIERQIVETALRRYNNNRERVAKELGVARSTLFKRLKDWGLTNKDEAE